jgi:chromosome segregation ATPase
MTEFKEKVAEQVEETVRLEEEKLLLIKENDRLNRRVGNKRAPAPAANKRRLELEKPANNSDQLAMEIIRLNKEINRMKYELKTANDRVKKAENELKEAERLLGTKNESLENLRRENEGLYLSVNSDSFKSV